MPYALVQDIAASWQQYQQFTRPLIDASPAELVLHIAGPTDEGFRIIEIWTSEQAWQRFQSDRLAPAIAALGGPARPAPVFRDLHPAHIVVGDQIQPALTEGADR